MQFSNNSFSLSLSLLFRRISAIYQKVTISTPNDSIHPHHDLEHVFFNNQVLLSASHELLLPSWWLWCGMPAASISNSRLKPEGAMILHQMENKKKSLLTLWAPPLLRCFPTAQEMKNLEKQKSTKDQKTTKKRKIADENYSEKPLLRYKHTKQHVKKPTRGAVISRQRQVKA